MNKHLLLISIVLLFISFGNIHAQEIDLCENTDLNCKDGEVLTYKIYYKLGFLWIPAGEVVFKSEDKGDHFELNAEGKTFGSYDPFFKVRDYFNSKIDKISLRPIEFTREVNEGSYHRYFHTIFNYEDQIAYTDYGKSKDKTTLKKYDIGDQCIQDVLSILYQLRTVNYNSLKKGSEFDLSIFIDNKVHQVSLMYNGVNKDKKVKHLGRYKTHLLIPETVAGNVFDENDKMKIWVSADSNRLPLIIESPISIGSIRAVLKSYSGVKNELVQVK